MKHIDEETLALLALGEPTDPSATEHLAACPDCRRDLDGLRRAVAAMPTADTADGELLAPPDEVWDAIAAELQVTARPGPPSTEREDTPADEPSRPRRLRRVTRFTVILAACAALLGAASGSAITWWVARSDTADSQTVDDGRRLESLRASSAGYASVTDSEGHRSLKITVEGLPQSSGYFEVWLMDRTHTKLVSMGVLGPDGSATLPVPDTIDLSEYSVVDVSIQPYNGKPDHSGNSIVRGKYGS